MFAQAYELYMQHQEVDNREHYSEKARPNQNGYQSDIRQRRQRLRSENQNGQGDHKKTTSEGRYVELFYTHGESNVSIVERLCFRIIVRYKHRTENNLLGISSLLMRRSDMLAYLLQA